MPLGVKIMKIKMLLFFLVIILIAKCSDHQNNITYENLQGDWVDVSHSYFFSFYDSTCSSNFSITGVFEKFKIKDDSLIFYPNTYTKPKEIKNRIKISYLKDDTLHLSYITTQGYKHSLSLYRKKNKINNDFIIDSIYLSTTFNKLDYFPLMFLRIDAYKNIYFEGRSGVDKKGKYISKLNDEQYEFLNKKLQNIELKSIGTESSRVDFAPMLTMLLYLHNVKNGDKKQYYFPDYNEELNSREFDIFINYLMSLYTRVKLNQTKEFPGNMKSYVGELVGKTHHPPVFSGDDL